MNTSLESNPGAAPSAPANTSASTYGEDRWQGPSFAASWITPPGPQRAFDDPTMPTREDDHA